MPSRGAGLCFNIHLSSKREFLSLILSMKINKNFSNLPLFHVKQRPRYGYYCLRPYMLTLSFFVVSGLAIISYGLLVNQRLFFFIGITIITYGIITTIGWWIKHTPLLPWLRPGRLIKRTGRSRSKVPHLI